LPRVRCNGVPSSSEEGRASSQGALSSFLLGCASAPGFAVTDSIQDLQTAELEALRTTLASLAANLEETVKGLPAAERHSYEEAEQSVVDARRKAETHEGLLQVN
jgi:hypothetical protein